MKKTKKTSPIIDKDLNQYDQKPVFQKKIEQVNELIKDVKLPQISKEISQ
ncbi:MAG: hypothetical protein MUE85_08255 [Microscillaceae bacterium]|jgi:hypothetical protein|nr:hypothetical protein [Microscillaceae bacterium]